MLVELTPDEGRYLLGMLNEQLTDLRVEIQKTAEGTYRAELQREQIRLERIIHRVSSAVDTIHKAAH
jgi:hypothetical protein